MNSFCEIKSSAKFLSRKAKQQIISSQINSSFRFCMTFEFSRHLYNMKAIKNEAKNAKVLT
jgi:hypothetical protein